MPLSNDIISQFVKITNDNRKTTKTETITYGVVTETDGDKKAYVLLDGTRPGETGLKQSVPVSTTVKVVKNDRVIVMIKNHSAIITGNLGNPAANSGYVDAKTGAVEFIANKASNDASEASNKVNQFGVAIANKLDTKEFTAEVAAIKNLEVDSLLTQTVKANSASMGTLAAEHAEIKGLLNADKAIIESLQTDKLSAKDAEVTYATIASLTSTNTEIDNLQATHASFENATATKFEAINATIENLSTENLNATYANIDFSNIGMAAIEQFFSKSGMIDNLVVGDSTVTGRLVGVTIVGDLIEGGTVVADKLVIQGEDGLYYKLNTDGVTTEAEQTEYNSLNGSVITAKSITATKIAVDDLVAFGATIGGFNITTDALYSGAKESIDNSTKGVYLDKTGQISIGDGDNYLRYFQAEDGNWKLEISAESILFGNESKSSASDIKALTEHVKIGTYTDPDTSEVQPCVELSEGDSDFKQIITNSATMFKDGDMVKTKIDTEGIETENLEVENEFRQGGFIWKIRANGNLGLTWKGGN